MSDPLQQLLAVMARLRDPDQGCAWDLEQSPESLAPYAIEEAYELADAVRSGSVEAWCEELGDVLLQVVFHAQIAQERGQFDFAAVAGGITEKLLRRHPHIFRDGRLDLPRLELTAEQVSAQWESIKVQEKALLAEQGRLPSQCFLDKVGAGNTPLRMAEKLQDRAAEVGYDWQDPRAVIAKLREEIDEFEQALDEGLSHAHLQDELGDILFCSTNLARQVNVRSEAALEQGIAKFRRRFGYIESALQERGVGLHEASLEEMEHYWQESKHLGL